ncbi:MAG TPA: TonB-dependent receptor [Steroidobacteraceae bacterium]|jgi:iron complex outermembrane receptor protein
MWIKRLVLPATVVVCFLHQNSFAQAPSPEASSETLETITITARKVTEDLQHASIAVTVLNSDDITRRGITDPTELQAVLPNIEFMPAGTPMVIIRGVGTENNLAGVDSSVAYSVDGIYLSHPTGLPPILYDINQVEAVRGPQGTLFGRNSNGGALQFNTNVPVLNQVQALAALTSGNYGRVGSEAMVNLPVGDTVALRLAFASDEHSPYFADGYQDADNQAGRARLLFAPTENLRDVLSFDISKAGGRGVGLTYCPGLTTLPQCQGRVWVPFAGLGVNHPRDFLNQQSWAAYNDFQYTTPWAALTWLSSFRRSSWDNPISVGPIAIAPATFESSPSNVSGFFTQELRLAGAPTAVKQLKWVFGLYYAHERIHQFDRYAFDDFPLFNFTSDGTVNSAAVFGQATWSVVDRLRITGGIRDTNERKASFGDAIQGGTGTPVPTGGRQSVSKVTWKAGIDFDLSNTSLLYGAASTGFKSGGVSQVPPILAAFSSYAPEYIKAYSIGSKNRFWNERLQANLEAFYYDYTGYQQYIPESDPAGGLYFATVNSQKATIYGAELETVAALTSVDRLSVALSVIPKAAFDQFVVGTLNFSGNRMQSTPKYTIQGTFGHKFNLSNGGNIAAEVETRFVDGHFVNNSNYIGSYQTSYEKTNLNIRYEDPSGTWSVTAFGNNLENKAVITAYTGVVTAPGGDEAYLAPPRTYGVTVQWRYR